MKAPKIICPRYLQRQCECSEMEPVQEHGNAFGVFGWMYLCRNCHATQFVSHPEMDRAARSGRLSHFSEPKSRIFQVPR